MGFQKGNTVNLGRKWTDEQKLQRSLSYRGRKPSEWGAGFREGNKPWNTRASIIRNVYFAALLDGEGSIFITNNGVKRPGQPNYKKVCVAFSMRADKAQPLPEGKSYWGGSLHIRKPRKSNINEALDWRMSSQIADRFLRCVIPFLKIKKEQAKLAIRLCEIQHKRKRTLLTQEEISLRSEIELKISSLNK